MKKIININLSGRVVPIEDSAYESLQRYIESLRRYFAKEEGRDEIINDIESRIAELMSEKIKKGAASITDADIEEIIQSMGRIEDFEEAAAEDTRSTTTDAGQTAGAQQQRTSRRRGRLYRDSSDKIIGGVGSGLANYLDVDPAVVRILLVLFGFTGTGILLYIILWLVLPQRDLNDYVGKRLFRNPDDRVIAGVASGLAAYFNKPSWVIRLILVAPLLLNILFGTFNGIFFAWHRDIFPNIFIAPFSGTFVLTYIILWMVLPEARSSFEKMEMRGEKVDVNRIRQNVKDEMEQLKTRAQSWGEEVRTSAQEMSGRAREFAQTRGKAFAGEVADTARPVARGLVHMIGVIIKAFFIFIAGCIALGLFAALIVLIFGGVAWWPINNFLWTSNWQKLLAWGTILLFLAVPVIGFMTWLIRRVVRVRNRGRNLSWIFGGLWSLGWVCMILFAISIAKDLRVYEKTTGDEINLTQPLTKLTLAVNEPPIHYNGSAWWIHTDNDNSGWDITENEMRYSNVKIRVDKSDDSLYHVRVFKYSAGESVADARARAERTVFQVAQQDSTLNMSSGITIDSRSKFRGQGVIVEVQVPVGRKIRFDESLTASYNPWVVRKNPRGYEHNWSRRYNYDWDYDDYFDYDVNVDYVMGTDGQLINPNEVVKNKKGVFQKQSNRDSLLREIEEREQQNERDRQKLQEINQAPVDTTHSIGKIKKTKQVETAFTMSAFSPLII